MPAAGSQKSVVHGFWSSGTSTGRCVTPVLGVQLSAVQALPSSIGTGTPTAHAPAPSHESLPVQGLPSLHDVPAGLGVCTSPSTGSQLSTVQGLLSLGFGAGKKVTHCRIELHASRPLQRVASSHGVPNGNVSWATKVGVQWSKVHGLLSSIVGGGTVGKQRASASQRSALPLQIVSSSQVVPAATGKCETLPVVASHPSSVQGLPSSMVSLGTVARQRPAASHWPPHTLALLHGAPLGFSRPAQRPKSSQLSAS
jgi:hypothetical protein